MELKVTKKDVLSGYIAQIFNYGTGLIVLPVVLHKLSAEEVGMNYVMLSVAALANMADFGFSGQIGRNVTYVLSGARRIYREEIEIIENFKSVDYKLLNTIIDASRFLYRRLSLAVLAILLSFGTVYMYHVTSGFTNVENSFPIWILFSISVYFNIYFLYYNSLLIGAALILEQRLATIYSRLTYIILCFSLLFSGLGLLSVVIANLVSPFVARYYSYYMFFSKEMKANLPQKKSNRNEIIGALRDIWATAKKSGTNTIGHYIGTQGSMFIAGAYLPLPLVAQWGLMTQLFNVVQAFASNMGMSFYPEYCKYRLQGDNKSFVEKSSLAVVSMIVILIVMGISIIFICPWLIKTIGSETQMPPYPIMAVNLLLIIVLNNAQQFAIMMTSRNVIPSPKAVIVTSFAQIILTVLMLQFFNLGLWALILGPAISGGTYTLWKWEELELRNMKMSAYRFYSIGFRGMCHFSRMMIKK